MRLTGKYRYLTFEDRKKIEAWHLLGDRPVDIAARLSVHHTTIYKELQRGATGTLDEDGARCTVEVTVYRLNAVAVTAFLLDGPETLLRHIGLDERDTYTTQHEIDDLVTVVHITREEATAWQH